MNVAVTNILKRIAVIISVFAIAWCFIDPVYADGNTTTYAQYNANDCWNSESGYLGKYKTYFISNVNVRVVYLNSSLSSRKVLYFVTTDSGLLIRNLAGSVEGCPVPSNSFNSVTIDSTSYYYVYWTVSGSGTDYTAVEKFVSNFSIPSVSVSDNLNDINNINNLGVYYTYGDGAVDPVEPIDYGLLDDVGFDTDIAGTGNASTSNVDTISWNPVYDTNGNNIMGASVSIRAVPGHYSAESKQNLFEKVRSDFILDNTNLAVLDTVNVEQGSFSTTWGQVVSAFSLPFGNFISWFKTDEVFLKQGWIYQIQFTKGDYTSEWQTVYTIQSESPADCLHVINSTVIDQDTINILQQINSINNSTNIWIIDETPVDPNDNYTPPASDDEKPWWAYLLEMINNSIGITNKYINDGTDESQQVVNNIETNNNNLDVNVTEYHDIENDLVNDMNDNVTDLDIEEDLSTDASFLSSARWVTEQFNTIVSDNPIGMILKFSLVLGFVTIFLGRFR